MHSLRLRNSIDGEAPLKVTGDGAAVATTGLDETMDQYIADVRRRLDLVVILFVVFVCCSLLQHNGCNFAAYSAAKAQNRQSPEILARHIIP